MKRKNLSAGAIVAAGVMLLSACGAGGRPDDSGASSTVGVTADTIKVGAHFPLTGVAAPGYSEIPSGARAYFEYVNANGGVHGRKIEYIVKDDAYDPSKTSQVVKELVLRDRVFAIMGGLGTPTHSAVLDFLNDQGVPDLFVSSGSLLWDQPKKYPMTFGWQPDYEVEGKIIGRYVKRNFPDAKVGLFLQDDDFGDDGEKGVRAYIDDQVVAEQRYVSGKTNIAPQISALRSSGADLIISFSTPSYTALSQLAALQLNWEPQWVYSNVGADPALVGSLLSEFSKGKVTDAGLLSGAITTEYLAGVDETDDPWVQLWQRVWDNHGGEGKLTNYRVYGMSEAYTFVQALQAAGKNLTRDGIVSALEKAGGSFEGPALAPFRYAPDSHAGISGAKVVEIQGMGGEDLTPVLVTDNGDAPVKRSTSENAPPPEGGIPNVKPVG